VSQPRRRETEDNKEDEVDFNPVKGRRQMLRTPSADQHKEREESEHIESEIIKSDFQMEQSEASGTANELRLGYSGEDVKDVDSDNRSLDHSDKVEIDMDWQ